MPRLGTNCACISPQNTPFLCKMGRLPLPLRCGKGPVRPRAPLMCVPGVRLHTCPGGVSGVVLLRWPFPALQGWQAAPCPHRCKPPFPALGHEEAKAKSSRAMSRGSTDWSFKAFSLSLNTSVVGPGSGCLEEGGPLQGCPYSSARVENGFT